MVGVTQDETHLVQINGFVPQERFLACSEDLHNIHTAPEHLLEEEVKWVKIIK